jgi:tetratricopeptide (TPR) repeat protein
MLGARSQQLISPLLNLAMRFIDVHRWDEARRLCEEALSISTDFYGPDHSQTINCKEFLANVIRGQTTGDEAVRLQLEVLEWRERRLGQEHPETLKALHNMAYDYELIGRPNDALPFANEVIEIGARVLSPDDPTVVDAMDTRVRLLEQQGKTLEARKAAQELLEVSERRLGKNDVRTITAMVRMSRYLNDSGDVAEARQLLDEAVALLPDDEWILRNTIAWRLATDSSADAADNLLALELATRACELTDYKAPTALDTLAAVQAERGDFEAAVLSSEKAVKLATLRQRGRLQSHLNVFKSGRPWPPGKGRPNPPSLTTNKLRE